MVRIAHRVGGRGLLHSTRLRNSQGGLSRLPQAPLFTPPQREILLRQARRSRLGGCSLLHGSARVNKSSSALDFTHSTAASTAAAQAAVVVPPPPDVTALRTLFVTSAVPMVGFGFMDNLVLIQAGQYIDSTLGVSLGLATMTAAACGQVVSDVSGVVFGGTLERFLLRLSLIESPKLSTAQRQLPVCRNVSMAGAVVGVVLGCALGATTLLLVDLEKRGRIERAQQLRDIVGDLVLATNVPGDGADEGEEDGSDEDDDDAVGLQADDCCLYLASGEDFQVELSDGPLSSDSTSSNDGGPSTASRTTSSSSPWRTQLRLLTSAVDDNDDVRECARRGKVVRSSDRTSLCIPVRDADDLLAVLQVRRRKWRRQQSSTPDGTASSSSSQGYSDADVRTAQVIAKHLAIFMTRLVE